MKHTLRWAALVLMSALLAACAAGPGTGKSSSQAGVLRERVLERWNYLIENNFHAAYEYLTPGYRATRTAQAYAATAKAAVLDWTGVEWLRQECDTEDSCKVELVLNYQVRMPSVGKVPAVTSVEERWIRVDGQWYFLPER